MVNVAVSAAGPDAADQLRSLHEWLRDVDELRGRVSQQETPPPSDALGPVLDAVALAVTPGTATAVAAAVIAWLRSRQGDVSIKITLPEEKSIELSAQRVTGLNAEALQKQVSEVAALLSETDDES